MPVQVRSDTSMDGPWSVSESARDLAKVVDQVRLLARTSTDWSKLATPRPGRGS